MDFDAMEKASPKEKLKLIHRDFNERYHYLQSTSQWQCFSSEQRVQRRHKPKTRFWDLFRPFLFWVLTCGAVLFLSYLIVRGLK